MAKASQNVAIHTSPLIHRDNSGNSARHNNAQIGHKNAANKRCYLALINASQHAPQTDIELCIRNKSMGGFVRHTWSGWNTLRRNENARN